ncbi:hypothetical protein TIFTF001_011609 [Ficus carica]|uniref:Uncharacterized protein n=1 Tax=Ficus carica TaxID=3494 RepID=A0AA87ZYK2_FICCA|nr:hypothetical protein TIFTF001_011609 [Ficus carica]
MSGHSLRHKHVLFQPEVGWTKDGLSNCQHYFHGFIGLHRGHEERVAALGFVRKEEIHSFTTSVTAKAEGVVAAAT